MKKWMARLSIGFLVLTIFVVILANNAADARKSVWERKFEDEVKATFVDAPETAAGRMRRVGQSKDGLYLVELVGGKDPHTVTVIAGLTKDNSVAIHRLMSKISAEFVDLPNAGDWMAGAMAEAITGGTKISKAPGGQVEVRSMMPVTPAISFILTKPGH